MIPDILLILGLTLVLTLLAEAGGKWLDEVEQRELAVAIDALIVVFLIVAWIGVI